MTSSGRRHVNDISRRASARESAGGDVLDTSKLALRWGAWLMNRAGLPALVLSTDISLFSPNA